MKIIDLRSDTVTRPTEAMKEAISQAKLGDDVWGDDPTTNRLQKIAAEMLGKEDSLFVPSGTMGNLVAALVHCHRGDELILGDQSHTFNSEAGNISAVGGIHPRVLRNRPDGTIALKDIESAVRIEDVHYPTSRAVFLENTQNHCGGIAIPPEYFASVRKIADRHNLVVHLDGARLFNAAVAWECSVQEFTSHTDSVTVCLSKGLCAPIGSILAGSTAFINSARRARKMLGGGMRQVGVIAAAGIVALEQMVDRLAEDHANAKVLAEGLQTIPGLQVGGSGFSAEIDPNALLTNMIFFKIGDNVPVQPNAFIGRLEREHKIKIDWIEGRRFRLVTHYWVTSKDIDRTLAAFWEIFGKKK